MIEEWKPIVGYEGWYSVSSFGRIRREHSGKRTYPGRILKQSLDSYGYPQLWLYKNGFCKGFGVHRLVAMAFLGEKLPGLEINHKDGNKKNNNYSNLEYTTRSENVLHCHKTGLYPDRRGELGTNVKLKERDVLSIRKLYLCGVMDQPSLARRYGVKQPCISKIILRQSWKHI